LAEAWLQEVSMPAPKTPSVPETEATEAEAVCEAGPRSRRRWAAWGGAAVVALLVLLALHLMGALRPLETAIGGRLPDRPQQALLNIVNVFTCCVLSWKALTTMLPAFVLAGAIGAFVPSSFILRYLGAGAHRGVAYGAAAFAGCVLSLCSCNVVPLFTSIYRRGAGIGPAFTFLFAGPAINVVAFIFTFQVIGWRVGLWRSLAVPIVGIGAGLLMSLLFRREERRRHEEHLAAHAAARLAPVGNLTRVWVLLALLLGTVVLGAWDMPWAPKLIGMGVLALLIAALARHQYDRDELGAWGAETWGLVRLVIPILLPMVLIIGAVAAYIDIKLVYRLVGPVSEGAGFLAHMRPILLADAFSQLMYFPILSEVAFTKAFLKLGMEVGPALAVLLGGPGLSLPGALLIARSIGWRKAVAYQVITFVLIALVAYAFQSGIGEYICACMMGTK
jgi:uncharacterized protein